MIFISLVSAPDNGMTGAIYWGMVADASTGEDHDLDAHGLAMAWIYGDVVHHDPQWRRAGDPFGLRDRFRAAVPLVAWAMVGTIELLNFIRVLTPGRPSPAAARDGWRPRHCAGA
ncbi:hypothetical protein [Streptomyces sp. NPDC127038]|uniref:hypothetical protein n=1 Tax=Streptomyces sp. NPDC127038 TaxID=3347114 RepID=UPI0036691E83